MPKKRFSKAMRAEIRKLQNIAWERELAAALSELQLEFDAWRAGKIDVFDLADLIHKFHDGRNRELYKIYTYPNSPYAVPAAIAKGIISESEVSNELMGEIADTVEHFRQGWPEDSE